MERGDVGGNRAGEDGGDRENLAIIGAVIITNIHIFLLCGNKSAHQVWFIPNWDRFQLHWIFYSLCQGIG